MLYFKFNKCKTEGCKICGAEGSRGHGPYVYAGFKFQGKNVTKYMGGIGKDLTLERVEKLENELKDLGIEHNVIIEYKEMLRQKDEIEYVEERIAIPFELKEKAYEANLDLSKLLEAAIEKELKKSKKRGKSHE